MTKPQIQLYWRQWGRVKKALVSMGDFSPADADAERHEIHRAALGTDRSHLDFSNRDFDAVLDHFAAYLVLETGPTTGPARAEEMPRTRLIFAIEKLGLDEPYLDKIASDQFGTTTWRSLPERQLSCLRFTAAARARAKAKKAACKPSA